MQFLTIWNQKIPSRRSTIQGKRHGIKWVMADGKKEKEERVLRERFVWGKARLVLQTNCVLSSSSFLVSIPLLLSVNSWCFSFSTLSIDLE